MVSSGRIGKDTIWLEFFLFLGSFCLLNKFSYYIFFETRNNHKHIFVYQPDIWWHYIVCQVHWCYLELMWILLIYNLFWILNSKNINHTKLSELSQVISSIVVIGTVIFIGVQIGQKTKATKASIRQSMARLF